MPTLTDAALRRAIAGGETSTVELKKAVPRPGELAERMCGMANAQGGVIIIGVEDSRLTVVGVPDARMALTQDMVLRAARPYSWILPSRKYTYSKASGWWWLRFHPVVVRCIRPVECFGYAAARTPCHLAPHRCWNWRTTGGCRTGNFSLLEMPR
jgi:hypothetical protein